MDLEIQQRIKDLTEKHGAENIVVVIGGAEAEASGLSAETVAAGDPTYAGPLAGVALGLAVYHMVEPEIKDECDPAVYDEQCGMMEMVLDVDNIISEVSSIREQFSKY
jgi:glycine/sarcosine/betaine reductase complex component A